jgi:hypothetical protein
MAQTRQIVLLCVLSWAIVLALSMLMVIILNIPMRHEMFYLMECQQHPQSYKACLSGTIVWRHSIVFLLVQATQVLE